MGKSQKHRDQVIADQGQWLGLLDENGIPMMDLPPVMEMRMRKQPTIQLLAWSNSASSLQVGLCIRLFIS
ncbi:hypothetical protein [Corynebacterium ulcerans]|uniref:hypothetical protein n=1 Tax=Corynebacterium ulcerans TaxID=65058 RepID=UPI002162266E|nr:hypothetical protein [Corynebacterium ulcerans]